MKAQTTSHRSQRVGMAMSAICAVHCAAMPALLAVLPVAGSAMHDMHWLEFGFIGLSVVIAAYGIFKNINRKISVSTPVILVVAGLALIVFAHLFMEESASLVLTPIGAIAIGSAQFINLRQARQCDRCEH